MTHFVFSPFDSLTFLCWLSSLQRRYTGGHHQVRFTATVLRHAGSGARPKLKDWLWNELAWIRPLLGTLLALMCFQNLWMTLTKTVPQTCKSKKLLKDTIVYALCPYTAVPDSSFGTLEQAKASSTILSQCCFAMPVFWFELSDHKSCVYAYDMCLCARHRELSRRTA